MIAEDIRLQRKKLPMARLRRRASQDLAQACAVARATCGIIWLRQYDDQLMWLSSMGIEYTHLDCRSSFTQDILLNVTETMALGKVQAFYPCDETVFLAGEGPSFVNRCSREDPMLNGDVSRSLVLAHVQFMLPIIVGMTATVVSLFLPASDSVPGLEEQRRLHAMLSAYRSQLQEFVPI